MRSITFMTLLLCVPRLWAAEKVVTYADLTIASPGGSFTFSQLQLSKGGHGRLNFTGTVSNSGRSLQVVKFDIELSDAKGSNLEYRDALERFDVGSAPQSFAYELDGKIDLLSSVLKLQYANGGDLAAQGRQQPPGGPWTAATLIDYRQDDGLRRGVLDSELRDKKAFTFAVRYEDGTIREFRKITGSLFDTTPSVVVNEGVWIKESRYDSTIIDHDGRKHRVKLVKTIAPVR